MFLFIRLSEYTDMMPNTDLNEELKLLHERVCPALGDPIRMRLIYAMEDKARSVSELVETLGIPQSTISRHLAILRNRHLVSAERKGTAVYYSLKSKKLLEVLEALRTILREQLQNEVLLASDLKTNSDLEVKL